MRIGICIALLGAALATACAPAPVAPTTAATSGVEPSASPASTPPSPSAEASQTPAGEPTVTASTGESMQCSALAASLPLDVRVGQLYMVGVSTGGLDGATRSAIVDHHVGSVVLLGNSTAGSQRIARVTDALAALDLDVPLAVAVDQEGGSVQRLKGPGFSDIPTAVDQAELPPGELEISARFWASELTDAGIHWNLAPVADFVPADKQNSNQPIGALQRNYGNDLDVTSRAVTDFILGMRAGGVATSMKHFPGLGHVTHNTDFDAATDTDITPDDETWQPFLAGMEAGASSVMVSSAVFTQLDPDQEAVFSEIIITDILRDSLGFTGVVIADDLGAAGAVADIPAADRGVRFLRAGGDVVINADPALMAEMVEATVDLAESDPNFERQVNASATRVLELKAWLGLSDCTT